MTSNDKVRELCIDQINDFLTTGWLTNSEAMDKKEVVKLLVLARGVIFLLAPKPPMLAEQALAALESDPKDGAMIMIDVEQFDIIRRALERLKKLEETK
jgi:16S rRNA G1207 methylase RsmC